MKFSRTALAAAGLFHLSSCFSLDLTNEASIRNGAATAAHGLMKYYTANATGTAATVVGTLPAPYYWWEAGAMWGGLVDYWAYTKDTSYVATTKQALIANFGPNADIMLPWQQSDEGNDDQAFWALTMMSAAEQNFPAPPAGTPSYLSVAKAAFDTMVPRWDNATTCDGGLRWQIFPSNSYGWNYMNSISNGGFFQLAARLARYTGNQTYVDWAQKIWDWSWDKGLIDNSNYNVYDGTDPTLNCTTMDHMQWTYTVAMYLYGAATMYNYTNGSVVWQQHVDGLLKASSVFFSPYANATDVMFEAACEQYGSCNNDQLSFKAYLSRWLAKTSVLAPYTAQAVKKLLTSSAAAAARSCSGGTDGVTCGTKWYTNGWDNTSGVGQQLSALETIQSLLVAKAGPPATQANVHISVVPLTTTATAPNTPAPVENQTPSNAAAQPKVSAVAGRKLLPRAAAAHAAGAAVAARNWGMW